MWDKQKEVYEKTADFFADGQSLTPRLGQQIYEVFIFVSVAGFDSRL